MQQRHVPKRRRYSRKKILALLCTVMLVSFVTRISADENEEEPMASGVPQQVALVEPEREPETEVTNEEKEVPPVVDCKVYPYKHFSKHLKDKLPEYKAMSMQAGIRPIKDDDAFTNALARGFSRLVLVEEDEAMYVAPMDYGKPYLTPSADQVLRSIATEFKQRIAGTDLAHARLKVTSLLRTSKDQRNLGRSNVNATRDEDAPHTHGTSMDISYMKFISQAGEQLELSGCQQVFLAETLAEVITELREKDPMIFAIKERKQACYHLTVCR